MDATAAARERAFWINTVSLDHVLSAVEQGFTQADHGANTRLRRLAPGDGMIFYSPRTELRGGDPVQQFTAIAEVTGDEPYQVIVSEEFRPWRLAVRFRTCTPVEAKPLVGELSFIADPARWGYPFRRGLFEVPEDDFETIALALAAGP
ncbi:MAG: hypothetical protein JWR01_2872 [Subtercola sp.]|nr:hypothetical protein [Subtercola sp.]